MDQSKKYLNEVKKRDLIEKILLTPSMLASSNSLDDDDDDDKGGFVTDQDIHMQHWEV